MIIITGYLLVNAARRDASVDAFRDMVGRARAVDGCVHFAITADSVDPERITTVEVWRDAAALAAWRKQAKGPRMGKPMFADVRQYQTTDGESLT